MTLTKRGAPHGGSELFAQDHRLPVGAWGTKAVNRLYIAALTGAYVLLVQSTILLILENDSQLKINLLMQIAALTLFAIFTRGAAGTYLNAPTVFAASIFMWHSTFLVGHYFELASIFAFDGGTFAIGFEYIYRATALVGLSLALTIIGAMWGYRRQRITAGMTPKNALVNVCYSEVASPGKRIAWYLFGAMVIILTTFIIREGPSAFGGKYMDLYANAPSSFSAVLFVRSQFFWVFVIILLIACYKNHRRGRNCLAICFVGVSVLTAMFGARSIPFVCLASLLIAWDCFVRRVKLRWIAIFVIFLSVASFVIASGREAGLGVQIFQFENTGREGVDLLNLFWEQGRSITVVLRTMDLTHQGGLVYGRTFFDSVVAVIPLPVLKLTGYGFTESLADRIVDISPDISLFGGAGSSLVAEFYYNFGMLGCLGFLIIGWYIGRSYFKYAFSGDLFTGLKVMTVVSVYTVMMRNETGSSLRLLMYAIVITTLLRHQQEKSFLRRHASREQSIGSNVSSEPPFGLATSGAQP